MRHLILTALLALPLASQPPREAPAYILPEGARFLGAFALGNMLVGVFSTPLPVGRRIDFVNLATGELFLAILEGVPQPEKPVEGM